LAEDLERWLTGEPIQARPSTIRQRAVKWIKRRPAIAALGGSLIVLVALGMGVVVSQWRRAEIAAQRAERQAVAERRAREEAQQAMRRAEQAQLQADEQRHRAQRLPRI
jgi:serine/threonine-protein kinase